MFKQEFYRGRTADGNIIYDDKNKEIAFLGKPESGSVSFVEVFIIPEERRKIKNEIETEI